MLSSVVVLLSSPLFAISSAVFFDFSRRIVKTFLYFILLYSCLYVCTLIAAAAVVVAKKQQQYILLQRSL